MGPGDLRLVGSHERSPAYDVVALDDEPVDAMRRGENEAGNRVLGAAELEAVGAPDGKVGALPRLE
jgi:hypothetical protein